MERGADVVVAGGNMVDAPDRDPPRLPADQVERVTGFRSRAAATGALRRFRQHFSSATIEKT